MSGFNLVSNIRYTVANNTVRFLLAHLYVEFLRDKRRKREVLSTLDQLPKGLVELENAYDKAIKQIDEQLPGDRSLAKRAISWITYAQRPLTTQELCHALSVAPGDKALDSDDIYDIESVTSVCAGLVTVHKESNVIRLVHYTTQEYFERVRLQWNPGAREEIAVACLTYLSFDTFRSGSCAGDEAFEQRLAENAFFDYSAHYWSEHIRPVQSTALRLVLAFLHNKALVDCTTQVVSMPKYKIEGDSQEFPNRTSGLHLTARYGLLHLTERLLMGKYGDSNIRADSKDSYGRTPLSWAAEEGHKAVIQLLAERGNVEADSKDNDNRTPLSWAAWKGHEAVVQLLVERDDTESDSKDNDGRTPLSWAAGEGHERVVRLLVERDDVRADSKDYHGRTPLSWAAWRGHEAVVQLLVERDDVEADSKDQNGWTPLSWAAESGREAAVKLLLETCKIDVDSKDSNSGRTPLSLAAASWQVGYFPVDLSEGVDHIDLLPPPLPLLPPPPASKSGHEAVVKLLLKTGKVDVDSKSNCGRTPLSWAAGAGYEAVVRLLIERDDVEADSKDNNGRTPLLWAAWEGREAVVRLLVEQDDVKADSKDDHGWTSLLIAVERPRGGGSVSGGARRRQGRLEGQLRSDAIIEGSMGRPPGDGSAASGAGRRRGRLEGQLRSDAAVMGGKKRP